MSLVNVTHFEIDGDFSNSLVIWQHFLEIVSRLPDHTVINSIKHEFPNGGFTGLILLSESHAAIHTWPELNKAWVELASCGNPKVLELFSNALSTNSTL